MSLVGSADSSLANKVVRWSVVSRSAPRSRRRRLIHSKSALRPQGCIGDRDDFVVDGVPAAAILVGRRGHQRFDAECDPRPDRNAGDGLSEHLTFT